MRIILLLLLVASTQAGFFDSLLNRFSGRSSTPSPQVHKQTAPVTDEKARRYLQDFGYVSPSNSVSQGSGLQGDVSNLFQSAVKKFQEFAGLAKTGILDAATKVKMALPRCGFTDAPLAVTSGDGFKWSKTHLTYSIENYSSDLPREQVKQALAEAYGVWSKVSPLTFQEVPAGSQSDIKIRFGTRNHNDPWPFDGAGGVLAHATMPESGMFHFDDDENWAYKDARKISGDYTDLLAVAIHEGGHTLGLEHSRDEKAIMAPFYQKTVDSNGNYIYPDLKSDDIYAIQKIYGSGSGSRGGGSSATTQRPRTTTKSWFNRFFGDDNDDSNRHTTTTLRPTTRWPETTTRSWGGSSGSSGSGRGCPSSVDAYTPSDSFSYLFSGTQVYVISGTRVSRVQSLRELFPSGPSRVHAAVFNTISGAMLLVYNNEVYSFYYSRLRGVFTLDSGFPKTLPSSLGFRVTGALRWINGHQILMGDNGEFAVYDEFWNQVTLKNRVASYFPNLPQGVKGIESPSGMSVTAFTSSDVFEYDSRRRTVGNRASLSSYIAC